MAARVLPSFRCRGQVRAVVLAALRGQDGPNAGANRPMRRNWQVNRGGILLAKPLQLESRPVTRVENFCATGSEALRQAWRETAVGRVVLASAASGGA